MPKVMIVKYRFPVHSVAVHMLKMIEKAPLCIMSWGEGFDQNDGFIAGESDLESRIENRDIIFTSDELVCFDEAKFWMSPGDLSEISISCTENEKGKYIEGEAYEWGLIDKPEPAVLPWDDNAIQFPRLIAEICVNVLFAPEHWKDLQDSMNLSEAQVNELFDRANAEWNAIKAKL